MVLRHGFHTWPVQHVTSLLDRLFFLRFLQTRLDSKIESRMRAASRLESLAEQFWELLPILPATM